MAYFSNHTEWEIWAKDNCYKCKHFPTMEKTDAGEAKQCPIQMAHLLLNYDECNKEDSVLHMLIPRKEKGVGNEACHFFEDRDEQRDGYYCFECDEHGQDESHWLDPFIEKVRKWNSKKEDKDADV